MITFSAVFSGFSVNDLAAAKAFYGETIGIPVTETPMGLELAVPDGPSMFVYQKDDHAPATFTILNIVVDDVDIAVEDLTKQGVTLEHYEGMTDEKGIARGIAAKRGPDIAWFKDPAGNVLSVLHNS